MPRIRLTAAVLLGGGQRGEIGDEVDCDAVTAASLVQRRRAKYLDEAPADPGVITSVDPVGTGAAAALPTGGDVSPPAGDA